MRLCSSMSHWERLYRMGHQHHQQELKDFINNHYQQFTQDVNHLRESHWDEYYGLSFIQEFCAFVAGLKP